VQSIYCTTKQCGTVVNTIDLPVVVDAASRGDPRYQAMLDANQSRYGRACLSCATRDSVVPSHVIMAHVVRGQYDKDSYSLSEEAAAKALADVNARGWPESSSRYKTPCVTRVPLLIVGDQAYALEHVRLLDK
jgi:hypothetical protein